MKRVSVREFGNALDAHLQAVRTGETLVLFDGETPVARVLPVDDFRLLPAKRPVSHLKSIKGVPVPGGVDIVKILRDSRDHR